MTTIKLSVPPDQTLDEEAELVASVAAAVTESTASDTITFQLTKSEQVTVGAVAARILEGVRWRA
ncbi:MAG: hypothetical protein ACRDYX_14970 [Egibacteraceae bacterium]